ncbi:MAG TPA: hypothetical protein VIC82_01895 [Candidatus Nanopelagicales bacterium]
MTGWLAAGPWVIFAGGVVVVVVRLRLMTRNAARDELLDDDDEQLSEYVGGRADEQTTPRRPDRPEID